MKLKKRILKPVLSPRLACLFLLLLAACTRPVDSDFMGQQQGLADDELLWILQIPRSAGGDKSQSLTRSDSLNIEVFNRPIFEQTLPLLIREMLEGKVNAYEDYEFTEEERPIQDLNERLKLLGASRQDLSPFLQVCELFSVVKSVKGKYQSNPRYLRVIWKDPEGKLPDQNIGSIKLSELKRPGYPLNVGGSQVDFVQYLSMERYHFYPVYVRSNAIEYNLQSEAEASFLKDMIFQGRWEQIDWLEGRINISGKKRVGIEAENLHRHAGIYRFEAKTSSDSNQVPVDIYLMPEKDYLVADWSHRFQLEKIFPFSENGFFSTEGELYLFEKREGSNADGLILVQGSDSAWGTPIR